MYCGSANIVITRTISYIFVFFLCVQILNFQSFEKMNKCFIVRKQES